MNIFEILWVAISVLLGIKGWQYFAKWGVASSVVGGVVGLVTPYLLGQLIGYINDKKFSNTPQGKLRAIAENHFDKIYKKQRIKSLRFRPSVGSDGSTIVTIYYGRKKSPEKTFFKFSDNSFTPNEITEDEAVLLRKK